jgi:hypothetical protein
VLGRGDRDEDIRSCAYLRSIDGQCVQDTVCHALAFDSLDILTLRPQHIYASPNTTRRIGTMYDEYRD